jgi:hypothetical protein
LTATLTATRDGSELRASRNALHRHLR